MPLHKNIWIGLETPYGLMSEYAPPGAVTKSTLLRDDSPETFLSFDPASDVAGVFVPMLFGSQIWISYECPDEDTADDVRYYYFNLVGPGGRCLISWGSRVGYTGRIAFGIYDGGTVSNDRVILEKRSFFFPHVSEASAGGNFEIRVYRAKARKRDTAVPAWTSNAEENGMRMLPSGYLKRGEPKRSHTYALIDSLSEPFARFQYYCRSSHFSMGIGVPHDIARAPPSRKSILSSTRDVPPAIAQAQQPHTPTKGFKAKDSLASRRQLMLINSNMNVSPRRAAEKARETFDELLGLSLVPASGTGNGYSAPLSPASIRMLKEMRGRLKGKNDDPDPEKEK